MKQQYAEAIKIALRRRRLAGQHFGREIHGRSRHSGCAGALRAAGAEVHQDDAAAVLAHDVLSLDVAVHQPCRMDGRKRAAEIDRRSPPPHRLPSDRARQATLECLSLDQFHPEPGASVAHVSAVNRDDVRMTNLRERARFEEESLDRTRLS